ncbi:MAG: hypothetical protein HQK93_00585 [Nitrospirae bacterium]|nr:hypothetical protein [Nitrospirota bacterium]
MSFDRKKLKIKPLKDRIHDIDVNIISLLEDKGEALIINDSINEAAKRIISARNSGSSIIFMMGGHVIRSGVQRYIIDLMERGFISCLSMNGSCIIHDFEFALIGATTESVARYIKEGQFGLWEETSRINDIINNACSDKQTGIGEAIGESILNGDYPYKGISIMAAAYRLKIPATVHIGIGYDITHMHSNFDGAVTGAASYRDFLKYVEQVSNIQGGVVMNFGSAVMAPEVYLKALSMARNLAHQDGQRINKFTTLVCDLHDLPNDYNHAEPSKCGAAYYFRPHKTMLIRTVSDGGESFYVKGTHAKTIPALWSALNLHEKK